MRLIDSDADVCFYVETWKCNCSGYGVQNVMAVDDISVLPEIPVESLPVVQQLRAELEKVKAERDAAIQELNGVDLSVGELADFIDTEIYPIVPYDAYAALRENADSISIWMHETEWRGLKED